MAKTLANVRDEVLRRTGELATADGSRIWNAAEIEGYIKEGYDRMMTTTSCKVKVLDLNDTINVGTVDLAVDAPGFYQMERVAWGQLGRIPPLDPERLIQIDPGFRTLTGDVYGWMMDGDGPQILRKVRVPAASATAKFRVEYRSRGAALTSGSSTFEMPDFWLKYIRMFALWKCYERDGKGRNDKMAKHYMTRYAIGEARLIDVKSRTRRAHHGIMGGGGNLRQYRPPRPQLPWNFPDRSRRRRY